MQDKDSIESVEKETFERVWKVAQELSTQERHFNSLQNSYRNMASGWLLATFGGISFGLSHSLEIPLPRELLIAAIAIAGSCGIALLWVLDLLVYHRLLDACFIEGLALEKRYPWLPPFRNNMMKTQEGHGVLFRTVGFYLAPVVLLVLIATAALTGWCIGHGWPFPAILIAAAGIIAAVMVVRLMRNKTENTDTQRKRLAARASAR
ncbi:MAG: hypothetical protein QM776_15750 [Rhodocyclaceae bacterium]